MSCQPSSFRHPIALLLALALVGFLSACSHSGSRGLAALEGAKFRDHDPEEAIVAVQDDIEEALVWRVKTAEFYRELRDKRDQGNLSSYFEMRDRLLPHATSYLVAFAAETLDGLLARNYAKVRGMHGLVRRAPAPAGNDLKDEARR